MAKYDEFGRELENVDPVEMPVKFKRPPTIHEMIAQAVRSESWKRKMESEGRETFEEANDFDVGDDVEPDSRYEVADDSEFAFQEQQLLERAGKDLEQEKLEREERKKVKKAEGKKEGNDGVDREVEE